MAISEGDKGSFFSRVKRGFTKFFIRFGRSKMALDAIFSRIQLGRSFTPEQLANLSKVISISYYEKGDSIFKEGDPGNEFYFIRKGAVKIFSSRDKQEVVLARLEVGDFFGEQALLEENPSTRGSSAEALSDCELLVIAHSDYIRILNPQVKDLLKKMGEKELIEMFCKTQEVLGSIKESVLKDFYGLILNYKDGEVIFKVGETANRAYFILSGNVTIEIPEGAGVRKVQLAKGSLFGELGVLNNAKRAGSAIAQGDVKLLSYSEKDFKKLYDASPVLQQYVNSIKSVYQIKHRNSVSLFYGKFLDYNSVIAIYNMEDGSTVTAAKAVGNMFFAMTHSAVKEAQAYRFSRKNEIERTINIKDHKILGVSNYGDWEEIREICNMILNQESITDTQIESFKKSGNLGISKLKVLGGDGKGELICPCLNISRDDIFQCLASGVDRVDEVIKKTGVGSVCGVCRPRIVETLGLKAMSTVKMVQKTMLQPDTYLCKFEFVRPQKMDCKPGQYATFSGLIDGEFVSRNFTLISLADKNPYLEIIVRQKDKGYFSNWLFNQAKEDSLIRVSQPMGDFVLPDENPKQGTAASSALMKKPLDPVVCFVEGIGMAPAIAFARYVALKDGRKLYVDYSEKTKANFIMPEEWNNITSHHTNIKVQFRATQEEKAIQSEQILRIVRDYPMAYYYICTSEPLENFITTSLLAQQIPATMIKTERFTEVC